MSTAAETLYAEEALAWYAAAHRAVTCRHLWMQEIIKNVVTGTLRRVMLNRLILHMECPQIVHRQSTAMSRSLFALFLALECEEEEAAALTAQPDPV